MRYSPDLVEEIRVQTDLVELIHSYLPLKQKGSSYFGLCPFHHESTPSFSVSPDKQLYYCFGCGASGNAYSFVMQMENCDFPEAVKRLADRANIPLPEGELSPGAKAAEALKQRLFALHSAAGRFYYGELHQPEGRQALEYLEKRQISPAVQKKFGLGYAPRGRELLYRHLVEQGYTETEMLKSGLVMPNKNGPGFHDRFYHRLMFPIFDGQGRCVGFGGRILDSGEPKYLNSPETVLFNKSKTLYGLHFAKKTRKRELILVEGYMDLLTIFQAGFQNVVAGLGTALNQEHVKVLQKVADSVILLYDSDEAGTNAARRAIPHLVAGGLEVKVAQVPEGKDPDEFIRTHGAAAFSKVLVDAVSHISFAINCIRKQYNMQNTEHKVKFTTEAAALLAGLDNAIEAEAYARETAAQSGISEESILKEVSRLRGKEQAAFQAEAEKKRLKRYDGKAAQGAGPKGLLEAQKDVLYASATDEGLYARIRQHLKPEEYRTPAFAELAGLIEDCYTRGESILPAELVNHFQTVEEQKLISGVFAKAPEYPDRSTQKKALQEEILLIKKAKLEAEMENADIMRLKSLLDQKRKLDALEIFGER